MSPVVITFLVILGIFLLLAFWIIAVYNGLVVSRNRFKNAFAQIDVQPLHGHGTVLTSDRTRPGSIPSHGTGRALPTGELWYCKWSAASSQMDLMLENAEKSGSSAE
jgi:hypothetical protein